MLAITYGTDWSRQHKEILAPLTHEEASNRFLARDPFVAVIHEDGQLAGYVQVGKNFAAVSFLDEHRREYLEYVFAEIQPKSLFLQRATHREFVGTTNQAASGTTYIFKRDGKMVIRREDLIKNIVERAEDNVDVSSNWEPLPEFGKYESIFRKER